MRKWRDSKSGMVERPNRQHLPRLPYGSRKATARCLHWWWRLSLTQIAPGQRIKRITFFYAARSKQRVGPGGPARP